MAGPLEEPPAVDVVVHTAGTVTDWRPPGAGGPSDVDLLRRVLATFPDARLVHVSTASVYDPYRPTVAAVESQAPVRRYSTRYAREKADAERLLAGRADTVVLRPRAVYGPGDRTVLPRFLAAIRGTTLWVPGPATTRQSLTSIGNMTAATLAACHAAATGVFNVTDAEPVILADALTDVLAELRLPVRIRSVPVAPAIALATAAELVHRCVHSPRPPRLTRYAIAQVAVERTLDISAARARLGYRPTPTSFRGARHW